MIYDDNVTPFDSGNYSKRVLTPEEFDYLVQEADLAIRPSETFWDWRLRIFGDGQS